MGFHFRRSTHNPKSSGLCEPSGGLWLLASDPFVSENIISKIKSRVRDLGIDCTALVQWHTEVAITQLCSVGFQLSRCLVELKEIYSFYSFYDILIYQASTKYRPFVSIFVM